MRRTDFDPHGILRGIGVREVTPAMISSLNEMIDLLCKTAYPRLIWRIFPLRRDKGLFIQEVPLYGQDIAKHLEGCSEAGVLAVTVSSSIDTLIRRFQTTDMAKAVLLDAAAGAACEILCAEAEKQIRARTDRPYMTARFSAGYGDFPLFMQGEFLRLLDAQRKIGLTVTQSAMLLPMKSVTAVVGLSDTPVKDARRYVCGVNCEGCPRFSTCNNRR